MPRNATATNNLGPPRWLRRVRRGEGPIFLAIADALEAAVREGELQAGDRLPPQREVAQILGVDFTTVTRAYGAARERGLVEGTVGRGTFVRARAAEDEAGRIDLSMNLPPPPDGVSLAALLADTTAAVLAHTEAATLMAYHPGAGTLGQKAAGADWLAPMLGETAPERLLVCPGAQAGLTAVLAAVARAGDVILVEPLTYPGIRNIAAQLGLRLVACPPEPEAMARALAQHRPAAVYLIPTTQNPTAATLDVATRRDLAWAIDQAGTWLIEDDPYGRLFDRPPPAIASFAPERSFYLATLSKCLSPGLRTAYLRTPPGEVAERTAAALRAVALMPAPLMTAVATRWIREGQAEALLQGVRREARARRAVAAEILPAAQGAAEGVHVWLDLAAGAPAQLQLAAQQRGLSLVTADAFAAGGPAREGVRISLGGPAKRVVLGEALGQVAALIAGRDRRLVV